MPVKSKIELASHEGDLVLRSISSEDIESLREWKNKNRKSFFIIRSSHPASRKNGMKIIQKGPMTIYL